MQSKIRMLAIAAAVAAMTVAAVVIPERRSWADWFAGGVPVVAEMAAQILTGVHVVGQTDVTAPAIIGTTSVAAPTGNLTTVNSTTGNITTLNGTTVNVPTVNATTINATTVNAPNLGGGGATITASTISGTDLQIDTGTKTATASGGSATLNKNSGIVTTDSLLTGAGGSYVLTIHNSVVLAGDEVFANMHYGTNTAGTPALTQVAASAGQIVVTVKNVDATDALNGTLVVTFMRLKN